MRDSTIFKRQNNIPLVHCNETPLGTNQRQSTVEIMFFTVVFSFFSFFTPCINTDIVYVRNVLLRQTNELAS